MRRPGVAFALGLLYAVTDEVHQTFVEGRHGAPIDVAIDTGGRAVGVSRGAGSRAGAGAPGPLVGSSAWNATTSPTDSSTRCSSGSTEIAAQLERIDARLEANEGLLQVSRELRALNDSRRRLRRPRPVATGAPPRRIGPHRYRTEAVDRAQCDDVELAGEALAERAQPLDPHWLDPRRATCRGMLQIRPLQ